MQAFRKIYGTLLDNAIFFNDISDLGVGNSFVPTSNVTTQTKIGDLLLFAQPQYGR